ncbi:MAG TPA: CopD family protein [Thermaerobacter sp.]
MSWYKVVVFLHVISAMFWVGGILFLSLVVVPAARRYDDATRSRLLVDVGRGFRVTGWAALGVLLLTGLIQMGARGASVANVLDGSFFTKPFGQVLGTKLLFVALMVLATAVHDFIAGPAAERAAQMGSDPRRLRRVAGWLARVTALLALIVVALAVDLVR